ncbi:MAG: patatin-like phospholipase family protein [Candidatus Dormibacteria bacterium]
MPVNQDVPAPEVAFVLGGGGHLGAHEVGMLRALLEYGIRPDLILGTSIGAINGAVIAASPVPSTVDRLVEVWNDLEKTGVLGGSMLRRISTLARSRTHVYSSNPLRKLLADALPVERIENLAVPFQCVAASIERAAEHWFTSGSIVDAVLASAALPGVLPPAHIDGEHFLDGGIVNSIPVGRAVQLGARTVYVLQVGRVESRLQPPRWPWEVGLVAFEIARRHRYLGDMATVPAGVTVHVLPTGVTRPPRYNDWSQFRFGDFSKVAQRIDRAHTASVQYLLETHGIARSGGALGDAARQRGPVDQPAPRAVQRRAAQVSEPRPRKSRRAGGPTERPAR